MKLKFNHVFFLYLITMEMELDIGNEINKLHKIMCGKKIPKFRYYDRSYVFMNLDIKLEYLAFVLGLTHNNPEIEIYLKELLKNFSVTELNKFHDFDFTILHYMIRNATNISLNSFEIIINFGISVNSQTIYGDTPLHCMAEILLEPLLEPLSECKQNIIDLFVKHGADLNILNDQNMSILDLIIKHRVLTKHLEIIIGVFMDFGAKTNRPYGAVVNVLEFIESYRCNNIKPAIKK